MIQSMTGYGEAQHTEEGVTYALSIRSLNNRFLKTSIKLPENLQTLEPEVEKLLRRRVQRGSVTYVLRVRNSSATAAYEINHAALDHYLDQVRGASLPANVNASVDLATILNLPGVCQPPVQEEQTRDKVWAIIEQLSEKALERLKAMRAAEGQALRADLLGNCDKIREATGEIAGRAPQVITEYHQKLRNRVATLLTEAKLEVDKESLLREVAVYADRCDVNEEIARLSSHLEQFARLCDSPEVVGRKLEFLTQEMLREANTIGSKSNDAVITRHVVDIKGGIDRLKEQVQNVE